MNENSDRDSKPSGSFGKWGLLLAVGIAVALSIPSVRNTLFRKAGEKAGAARELERTIEALVSAELASQPLPGMKAAPQTHIVPSGLTNHTQRAAWHRTPEGSDVFPLALFRALLDPATGRPLIESFDKFGLIPAPDDDTGLPVGFSRIKAPGKEIVLTGINCAACHSSHITYKGRTLLIDGAPNMLDVEAFFRGTLNALKEQIEHDDPKQRVKFLFRFAYYNAIEVQKMNLEPADAPKAAKPSHDELRGYLKEKLLTFGRIVASFEHQTPAGPGRADSFGIIRNMMMTEEVVGASGNFQPMTAPVSIPHLFGFGSFTNLHWDGNTTTGNDRNYAQAVALGANFNPADFASSIRPYDLFKMETNGWYLVAPKWPAETFGPLDDAKVARGSALFRSEGCVGCHDREGWHKLEVIGTDPNRLRNYNVPVHVRGGHIESYATNLLKSSIALKLKAYADNQVPMAIQTEMDRWRDGVKQEWIPTLDKGYFTRPLRGVWATAPFLHNNSVPTLWDLLQPASQRPKKFAVGHREFDPVRVGYVDKPGKVVWELDTSITGNHNTGHEFGTRLTDAQKWDLIEFLKTL